MTAKVVIAPDSFKGSASAADIASALAAGWAARRPADEIILLPMADGGEGTLEAFRSARPESITHPIRVTGPTGSRVDSSWLMLGDRTAVVELASTSGIGLVHRLEPLAAHTIGFGEAIAAAIEHGADRLLLAVGGSASTDGGVGALAALGARFLDSEGNPVPAGGGSLSRIQRVDFTDVKRVPRRGAHILRDVDNPLLGRDGASNIYGPQKGAQPKEVAVLEDGLSHFSRMLGQDDEPGSGAGGGTAFGLRAWGATMSSGAAAVADIIGLPEAIAGATAVITGEGRYDSQSANGKVASYVSRIANGFDVPAMLAAGTIRANTRGFAVAVGLDELAGSQADAFANPRRWAAAAGNRLAGVFSALNDGREVIRERRG